MDENEDRPGDASRRSLLKNGAVATPVVLGAAGVDGRVSGTADSAGEADLAEGATGDLAAAQDPAAGKAVMFADEFHPGARFRVVSPVIDETPDVEAVQEEGLWSNYDTRVVEYLNTGERVLFFPVKGYDVAEGEVYTFLPHDMSIYSDDEGILAVKFDSVPESESDGWDPDDVTRIDGGGSGLVSLDVFYGGGLFRVVSGVVDWTPEDVDRAAAAGTGYDTRFASYLDANDEFLFYPSDAAAVERGHTYVMREDFTITDRDAGLVAIDFDRVDAGDLE